MAGKHAKREFTQTLRRLPAVLLPLVMVASIVFTGCGAQSYDTVRADAANSARQTGLALHSLDRALATTRTQVVDGQEQLIETQRSLDSVTQELAAVTVQRDERSAWYVAWRGKALALQDQVAKLKKQLSAAGGPSVSASGWQRPVAGGHISSRFGWRTHPISGAYTFHNGVDIAVPYGRPVYAPRSGTVSASWVTGYGNQVRISTDLSGWSTSMSHLSRIAIRSGHVSRGQVVGYVGSTGYSTGPHVHWIVTHNGTPVNPLSL